VGVNQGWGERGTGSYTERATNSNKRKRRKRGKLCAELVPLGQENPMSTHCEGKTQIAYHHARKTYISVGEEEGERKPSPGYTIFLQATMGRASQSPRIGRALGEEGKRQRKAREKSTG